MSKRSMKWLSNEVKCEYLRSQSHYIDKVNSPTVRVRFSYRNVPGKQDVPTIVSLYTRVDALILLASFLYL